MTSTQRSFLIRFAVAAVAALVVAPVLGDLLPHTPFHRILTRCFLVSLILAFAWGRGRPATWPGKIRAMGLRGPGRLPRVGVGIALGLFFFGIVLVVSWLLDGRAAARGEHDLALGAHIFKALGMGVGVALFEETLCRGYFKDVWGGPVSALLYAAAHNFRPSRGSLPSADGYDPLEGVKRVHELFGGWTEPQALTLGLVSLFVFGLALNRLRDRTGTLYLGIGLHGGLVSAVELYRRWLDSAAVGDPWVFGGPRLYDGVIGLLVMLAVLAVAHRAPLPAAFRRGA